jgi:hypothetical protein
VSLFFNSFFILIKEFFSRQLKVKNSIVVRENGQFSSEKLSILIKIHYNSYVCSI